MDQLIQSTYEYFIVLCKFLKAWVFCFHVLLLSIVQSYHDLTSYKLPKYTYLVKDAVAGVAIAAMNKLKTTW